MSPATRCASLLMVILIAVGCGGAGVPGDGAAAEKAPAAAKATTTAAKPKPAADGARYVAENVPGVTLALKESAKGAITGTLTVGGAPMPLVAQRKGAGYAGTVGAGEEAVPFTAIENGDVVVLDIGTGDEMQRLNFRRAGAGGGTPAPATSAAQGKRNVVINDQRLSDEEVARAEQAYRIQIPDADYWYDKTLGAWGVKGSPTLGLIAPGLDLGGPLKADASGKGTNIFVNGRELHAYDVMALQQITGPISPGRYFITAQGIAGYEGGPPLWDLGAMAVQSRGGGGGSNTWQSGITGASGFSDGTTGAVFLPNGGIVSTGN